jgi:hypothetical protein
VCGTWIGNAAATEQRAIPPGLHHKHCTFLREKNREETHRKSNRKKSNNKHRYRMMSATSSLYQLLNGCTFKIAIDETKNNDETNSVNRKIRFC